MPVIKSIKAREILDSRGNPTVETTVTLDNNISARASVPSGASTGRSEAIELRDNDLKRYGGMGVLKAVENVNTILGPKIIGQDPTKQVEIDKLLISIDGTENKGKLGGNAILSVSIAVCRAAAMSLGLPLYQYVLTLSKIYQLPIEKLNIPIPFFNLINGGKHGAGNLEFQEFHVIPSNALSFSNNLKMAEEIYQMVEKVLIKHGAVHSIGDEGGYAPNLFTNLDALEIVTKAISEAGYEFRKDIFLGLDVATSSFYKNGVYSIRDRTQPMDRNQFIEFLAELCEQYPLLVIEDPIFEDDWEGWTKVTSQIQDKTLVVGDDLLCTNPQRVMESIKKKACNAVLVKPNQIGTLSETLTVIKLARDGGLKVIVSHRSGETNDDFIADFAVGVGADFVKFGAPARGERVAKYNRLLEIENELKG